MMLSADDMVRVHNNSATKYTFRWNSKPFIVQPGRDGFMPFSLVKKDFGDPRSQLDKIKITIDQNTVEYIPARHEELQRLSILYGAYEHETDWQYIKSKMADVTVFNLEGEELIFPCDDPDCRMISGQDQDEMDRNDFLMSRIADMERQLLMFKQMAQAPSQDDIDAVETDAPNRGEDLRVNIDPPDDLTAAITDVMTDGEDNPPLYRPKVKTPVLAVRE